MSEESKAATARTVESFVDTMIPGETPFPAASEVRVHAWLIERCEQDDVTEMLDDLVGFLDADFAFAEATTEQRADRVRDLERSEKEMFQYLMAATYFGYYQTAAVVEAVNTLGRPYNHAPQPRGYQMLAFDPGALPSEPRGSYVATAEVQPVDLSGLDSARLTAVGRGSVPKREASS